MCVKVFVIVKDYKEVSYVIIRRLQLKFFLFKIIKLLVMFYYFVSGFKKGKLIFINDLKLKF